MKQSVRKKMEEALEKVIPADGASDFNQGLIELGAIVCVPNGEPKCGECPVAHLCEARKQGDDLRDTGKEQGESPEDGEADRASI